MIKKIIHVLVWSENYRILADWYIDKLGFKNIKEFKHPDDTGVLLNCGQIGLWIGASIQKLREKIKTFIAT